MHNAHSVLVVIRPFGGALVAKQQHVIDQWCKAVGVPDHEEPTDDVTVMCAGAEGPGDDDADTGVFDDDDADVVQVCALVCQQFIATVLVMCAFTAVPDSNMVRRKA